MYLLCMRDMCVPTQKNVTTFDGFTDDVDIFFTVDRHNFNTEIGDKTLIPLKVVAFLFADTYTYL